ncbi:hypothetical protein AGLY_000860 [Aphis glycines]|uniref:Uncharacterized protein n=1 Tax=Aphis glycines TaxID=307491 RepID=A0A6G0U8N9_APHGL|nr:hypothetical protein AGLY_000860 [Aphis glycines]
MVEQAHNTDIIEILHTRLIIDLVMNYNYPKCKFMSILPDFEAIVLHLNLNWINSYLLLHHYLVQQYIPVAMKFWSSVSVRLGGDRGKLRRTDELGPSGWGDPGSGCRATVIIGRSSSTTLCTLLRNMAEPSAALRSMVIIRSAARLKRRPGTGTATLLSVSDFKKKKMTSHPKLYISKDATAKQVVADLWTSGIGEEDRRSPACTDMWTYTLKQKETLIVASYRIQKIINNKSKQTWICIKYIVKSQVVFDGSKNSRSQTVLLTD